MGYGCFMILWLVVWFCFGIYGACVNIERHPRWRAKLGLPPMQGTSWGDALQDVITVFLGPLGLIFAMDCGGELKFWKRKGWWK